MRVMTFNLRFDNPADGPNDWAHRRAAVAALVQAWQPEILGTQEGMRSQLEDLEARLPEYELHAPDRIWDATCQYPSLFAPRALWRRARGEDFWLSETPRVHRSKSWNSGFPRMLSSALLVARADGRSLRVIVTHLDHLNSGARLCQAARLAAYVQTQVGPLIVMGDFNDHPGSDVHRLLTSPAIGLSDTWEALGRPEDPAGFTHHAFTGVPQKTRMDWVLVSRHFRVRDAAVVRDTVSGRYPSDHFPYAAELEWEPPATNGSQVH